MGTTIWSPLASGLLPGKYSGNKIPEDSHVGMDIKSPEEALAVVDSLKPMAERLGCSMAQLGLAWTLKNPNVSTTICGASKPEQMEQNLKALEVVPKLTPEVMEEIEKLLNNKPAAPKNWGRGTVRLF